MCGSLDAKGHVRQLCNSLANAVEQRRSEVVQWRDLVVGAFGRDFDPVEVVQIMRGTVDSSRKANAFRWGRETPEVLLARIRDSRDLGAIKENLGKAEKACESADKFDVVLSNVSQLDDPLMEKIRRLIAEFERFLNETLSTVDGLLENAPADLDLVANEFKEDLELLSETWNQITGKSQ